ncbi:uncharacterized protein LOC141912240 [Tubulanus polymorphus]|uniref:uncharacterized protein LOC141912240 n=1 Tax=Tubulanus polymorphus TaxID=672921 RepID=UPI003DA3C79A
MSSGNQTMTDWVSTYIASAIQDFPRAPASEFSRQLYLYACPIVFVTGIVGNFLSFCTMCTKQMRNRSYSLYLAALAVYDTTVLLFSAVVWVNVVVYYHKAALVFKIQSRLACMLAEYSFDVLYIMSSWTIVAVTFDRFVVIVFPIKGRQMSSTKMAAVLLTVIAIIALSVGSFHLVATEYDPLFGCYYTGANRGIAWVRGALMVTHIPFVTIAILNCVIVIVMHRSIRLTTNDMKSKRIRRATVTVLAVSTMFLFCVFPMGLLSSLVAINPSMAPSFGTAFDIARLILSVNNCINFYVYVLTGQEIRLAVLELLKYWSRLLGCCWQQSRTSRRNSLNIYTTSTSFTASTSRVST